MPSFTSLDVLLTEDSGHKMMPWVPATIRLKTLEHTKLGTWVS